MKIDLSNINTQEFFLRPCIVGGDACVLVEPHGVGVVRWTKDNLHLRSSIWTANGKLVSPGQKKFFNLGEENDRDGNFVPGKVPFDVPTNLDNAEVYDKLDGSLLIVSFYKGETIIRTRGTISAQDTLSNGHEISYLKEKYSRMAAYWERQRLVSEVCDVPISYHYEWTTPTNRIVLDYGNEPQLWLIGAINHNDYSLMEQGSLNQLARLMDVPRPECYPSMTMKELRQFVANLRGKEGVVIYDGNQPWKCKSLQYLALHYSRGRVNTFDKVIDIWLEYDQPDYQTFFDLLVEKEDYETADYCRASLSKLADAQKVVNRIIDGMKTFIAEQLEGKTRKEQYEIATAAYGNTPRRAMVMTLLDGKPLKPDSVKKLVLQSV